MSILQGAQVLVTGGAGTIGSTIVDQLLDAGAASVDVLDNLVRGRRENLADALASGRVELVEGDIRDRDLVHDLTPRQRPRLPPGGHPDHPVRRGATAGPRGPGRRHVQRRSRPRRRTASARWSPRLGLGLRHGGAVPDAERHHHYNNDTLYGAAKSFNEGMLRSFHAMHGLDYVALRYFNVYGPRMDVHGLYTEVLIRWMERIADGQPPLILGDGQQTMDFVYTEDIARANVLAAPARSPRGSSTSPAAPRPACSSWPRRCCGPWAPTWRRARPGACGQRRRPVGWPTRRRPGATRLHRRDRSRRRAARLVDWWRPLREETRKPGSAVRL